MEHVRLNAEVIVKVFEVRLCEGFCEDVRHASAKV